MARPDFGRRAPTPPTPPAADRKRTVAIVLGSLYLGVCGVIAANGVERHRACEREAERDPGKDPAACRYFSSSGGYSSSHGYYFNSGYASRDTSVGASHRLSFGGFGSWGAHFGSGG